MKSFIFLLFFLSLKAFGQQNFVWKSHRDKIEIPFQFASNLIVFPVKMNGVTLKMVLDTGSESAIIFSLPENDSIQFDDTKKVKIKGLGSEETIEALYSEKNSIDISGYANDNFPLLIVLDQEVNISARLGIEVNGILNNSFFKESIVEINYTRKRIIIHKSRSFLEKKKISKYAKLPLKIINGRPYVSVDASIKNSKTKKMNLLVDIGLSDGLWLFENENNKAREPYFEDILGIGLSGNVLGKRSRVDAIKISDFEFAEALVSYPYEIYFPKLGMSVGRNGSLGGGILSRFNVIFDFQGNQMLLKPNSKYDDPFNYNMSGVEIQHNGMEFVNEPIRLETTKYTANTENLLNRDKYLYKFTLKPIFEIATVRKNSPADLAGIQPNDKVIKINKRSIHGFSIQKINELLQSEEGRWIYMEIERDSKIIAFKFQLKKII